MRSQFCHGMCTYAQKSMTLPRDGEEESALTSEARLGDRLGIKLYLQTGLHDIQGVCQGG